MITNERASAGRAGTDGNCRRIMFALFYDTVLMREEKKNFNISRLG